MKRSTSRRRFCIAAAATLLAACSTSNFSTRSKSGSAGKPERAFIIHGYGATPDDHWFPWLAAQLQMRSISAQRIALPGSDAPEFSRWQQALTIAIGNPSAQDIFIAHSLGCISLLHYLSQMKPARIGGLVLASGFAEKLPNLSEIDGYDVDAYVANAQLDIPLIRAMSPHIISIISDDDLIVAPQESMKLARMLDSHVIHVPKGGHLLASDGFTELPQALQAIDAMLSSPP